MPVQTVIKLRRSTASQWTSTNPTLAAGEPGFETDTNKFKIGTGAAAWTALPYAGGDSAAMSAITTALAGKASATNPTFTVAGSDTNTNVTGFSTNTGISVASNIMSISLQSSNTNWGNLEAGDVVYFTGASTLGSATVPVGVRFEIASITNAGSYYEFTLEGVDAMVGYTTPGTGTLGAFTYNQISDFISEVENSGLDTVSLMLVAPSYTISSTELSYLDGVTSAIQTQLDAKASTSYVDSEIAAIDLSTKQDVVSGVSSTEIGYLDGVTSAIQTQLNSKVNSAVTLPVITNALLGTVSNNALVAIQFSIGSYVLILHKVPNTAITATPDGTAVRLSPTFDPYGTGVDGSSLPFTYSSIPTSGFESTHSQVTLSLASGSETAFENWTGYHQAGAFPLSSTTIYATVTQATKTITSTEISYLDGVTSGIQTQLDKITAPPVSGKSANYTIQATDANTFIRSTGSAITVTVANVLTPGQSIDFIQDGTGQITFAAGSGVTLSSADSMLKTAKQYAAATVVCVASGQYRLIGNIAA